jgi:transposase
MRGRIEQQAAMLVALTPDQLVPRNHPIRRIDAMVSEVLKELSPTFTEMYSQIGRPSIPPERLLRATVLMALFTVRSERLFCEELRWNMLFKWFLGMNVGEAPFDPTTFSKNRERLLAHDIARAFFRAVVVEAGRRGLLSEDHFSVDGTLLQAWASLKSYQPRETDEATEKSTEEPTDKDETPKDQEPPARGRGRNPDVDFRGQKRSRETHESRTDPEALLYKKAASEAAKLSYAGHALTENRHGLVVEGCLTQATGSAEREATIAMLDRIEGRKPGITLGADKAYDTYGLLDQLRARDVVPHIAWNDGLKKTPVPPELAADPGYQMSQRLRKRIEEVFGWLKTVGGGRKLRYIGLKRNEFWLMFGYAIYDLVRMANLETTKA